MTDTSKRPKVLLTLPIHLKAEARLELFADVLRAPDASPATLSEWAADADAVIVRAQLPVDIFKTSRRLRVAVRHGSGVDMIPIPQATESGVVVANVPGVNARSVSEYVLWALLSSRRRLVQIADSHRLQQSSPWQYARQFANDGHEVDGSRIGIIGFGNVGKTVSLMLQAIWQVEILAYNINPIVPARGVRQCELDVLLSDCDVVILALPLTDETRGLINAERLALMREGSVLINVARGPIVDESDLLKALDMGRPALAVLDVFNQQPLPVEHPLWRHPNVTLTPHVAGVSDESMLRMGVGAVEEVQRVLGGQKPLNFINPIVWGNRRAS